MYIVKRKNKNSEVYYLCNSYRDPNTKKNSTKVVEKLGSEDDIRKKYGKDIDLNE